jgi:hypothetical protein
MEWRHDNGAKIGVFSKQPEKEAVSLLLPLHPYCVQQHTLLVLLLYTFQNLP